MHPLHLKTKPIIIIKKMKRNNISIFLTLSCAMALVPMLAWAQSNDTTTLKIAIPVRGFNEFVTIQRDLNTGQNNYSGLAIEVFKAAINATLPSTSFKFVPFQKSDGSMNGTFDDMLKAVASKDYDGAVGEISILFYRTEWVDFTMPFMESSITLLVRIKAKASTSVNGYSLIRITYAFLIIACVVCAIPPITYLVGLTKWAKFVGGNDIRPRDKTLGSLTHTRLLNTTFFLILIIPMSAYIVSQASSLNQRRSASVTTLTELMRKDASVGYNAGSFIYDLLIQQGFSASKLISLKSEDDMVSKLSKGTSEGGVDAIVGDSPYLKLLEAKHCDEFTVLPSTNLLNTGFGFAFSKGSALATNISSGILEIVDNGQLGKIQQKTIGNLETCRDDTNLDVGSSFLSSDHKWIVIIGGILVAIYVVLSIVSLY